MSAVEHEIESVNFSLPKEYMQFIKQQNGSDNIISLCGRSKQIIIPISLKIKYVGNRTVYGAVIDIIFFVERPDLQSSGQAAFIVAPASQHSYNDKDYL